MLRYSNDMEITRRDISFLEKIMTEVEYYKNSSEIIKFDFNHQFSFLFDANTLINREFQVFTSFILCVLGFIGALFHTGILFRRYFHFSHHIFIQSLFDSFHLINILFTHIIFIIVYMKTSTIDCPLSTFFFSLISFISISFLCLQSFYRYIYLSKEQYHRLLAHRFILITSISWIILNIPKLDFSFSKFTL